MKQLLVANRQPKGKYSHDRISVLLKAQIENALELGWDPENMLLVSNFPFTFRGVGAIVTVLNDGCLTGSKMFAVKWLMDNKMVDDMIWAHDLDAWQNAVFEPPEIKDVGISTYNGRTLNGGSVFWKNSAYDIVDQVVARIELGEKVEEPTLNRILHSKKIKDRVTIMNSTFNVGCSGYVKRLEGADKPVKVAHFNPVNTISWSTHVQERNGPGTKSINERLQSLLVRWFNKEA